MDTAVCSFSASLEVVIGRSIMSYVTKTRSHGQGASLEESLEWHSSSRWYGAARRLNVFSHPRECGDALRTAKGLKQTL